MNYEYTPIFKVTGSKGSVKISAWFADVAVLEAVSHFDIGIDKGVTAEWIGGGSEPLTADYAEYDSDLKRINKKRGAK